VDSKAGLNSTNCMEWCSLDPNTDSNSNG
jgi:hypothetical protein